MKVNHNKLHPIVKDILSLVMSVKDDIPNNMVLMMINYALAEVASNLRGKLKFYNGETKPLNFYAYIFAESGCVDGSTEFMTPTGWKRIDEFNNDMVLQSDKDGNTEFVIPSHYTNLECREDEKFWCIDGGRNSTLNMCLTGGHRVLTYATSRGVETTRVRSANEIFESDIKNHGQIKSTFKPPKTSGLDMSDIDIKRSIAFKADGTKLIGSKWNGRIRVKHQYKKELLRELFDCYKETQDGEYSIFWIAMKDNSKVYNREWYGANEHQLKIIYDEAPKWDGGYDKKHGGNIFRTTKKNCADFMQYVFSSQQENYVSFTNQDRHDKTPFHTEYVVRVTNQKKKNVLNTMVTKEEIDSRKYCFTVPSSFWVARRNGFIFITGNTGKDLSLNTLNRIFIDSFSEGMKKGFEKHKTKYWESRSMQLVDEECEDVEAVIKEEMRLVSPFSYRISSGTEAGISKARVTYGLYDIGAINLVIDELGANYPKLRELLAMMLSTYEDGNSEARMLKNESVVAVRGVPSNFLGYSSPSLVFDGGSTEKMLLDDLSQGQARRSFFAFATKPEKEKLTAKEIVARNRAKSDDNSESMDKMNNYFKQLASPKNMYREVIITEDSDIRVAEYQIKCDEIIENSRNLQEQERIELTNRPYKALRLAGVYAFIDGSKEVTVDHIEQAIYVAEISGLSFQQVCNQPPVFQRVFEFIRDRKKTSDVDLAKKQWFKGTATAKRELLQLSRAYGYENDHLFKIKEVEGVEFYSFIPMPKTNVDKITVSISTDIAKGFKKKTVPFSILHEVVAQKGMNYSAGTFKGGHRNKANYEQKQNLIIIDVDDSLELETAKLMFANYKCLIATTKSHQKEKNGLVCDRFRIIFVTDRTIQLDSETYSRFMGNIYESLGVPADESCRDSSRFYYGADGEYYYSDGDKLLEVSDMIPDTSRERERKVILNSSGIGSTFGVERLLLEEAMVGARNINVLKWSLFLADSGYSFEDAKKKTLEFNDKLPEPLKVTELNSSVLKTLKGKYND